MASKPYLLITGIPLLLPFFVRCMPPPWDAPDPVLRRQLDPVAATRTTVIVAATSTMYTTVTNMVNAAPSDPPEPFFIIPPDDGLPLLSLSSPSPSIPFSATIGPPSPSFSPPPSSPDPNLNANPATGTPAPNVNSKPMVMAYYPDYVSGDYPPENIDFSRFDWIDFAFAVPDEDLNLTWDGSDDAPYTLRRLVSLAHASNKRVKLSVGGWSGSQFFSSAAASARNRTRLANNILALYQEFDLDGIDIDWEYPAQEGDGGNIVSPDDSANFLAFLSVLRETLPEGATITAATQTVPFADVYGNPMVNVSNFARLLDWVLIMNYDTWGSSSDPGPNAPLSDACHNSTQEEASALAALQVWTAAGFAPGQLVLGVPSYGYVSRSSESMLQSRDTPSAGPSGGPGSGSGSGAGTGASRSSRFSRTSRLSRGFRAWQRGRTSWQQRQQQPRRRAPSPQLLDMDDTDVDWVSSAISDVIAPGVVQVKNDDGRTNDGQVQFRALVEQDILRAYDYTAPLPYTPPIPLGSTNTMGAADLGIDPSSGVDASPNPSPNPSSSSSSSTDTSGSAIGSGSGSDSAGYGGSTNNMSGSYEDEFSGAEPAALRAEIENREPRALFAGASGFVRMWDACSSTPWLRSESARQIVTYDDPVSLEMKAQLVREAGMRGVNMFDVHGDTDDWDLTDAVRRGLGVV